MITGVINIPKFDGLEIRDNIFLIGEPRPIEGTNKLRCLANAYGCLVLLELSIKFPEGKE